MPIYEYRCEKCESDFEQLIRSSRSDSAARCPSCGTTDVQRKLSLFGMASRDAAGKRTSATSGCSTCRASSCAGCRK